MALLNFATSYSDVSSKLQLTESTTGDYIKLYFTKDGHIITHGTDYIPWGKNGTIPINRLPVDSTKTDIEHLWDSKTINDKINASFKANDAMRFKGTMGLVSGSTDKYTINGTEETFPSASAVVGDTYRITSPGSYAGQKCETGDLLICITDGSSTTAATWTVAQTNINGIVYHKINNVSRGFYSNDTDTFTIYAPTGAGAKGQLLISAGGTSIPTWTNQSTIIAGGLTDDAKKALFSAMTYNSGTLSLTVGGTTKSVSINGGRAVQVNGTEQLTANSSDVLNLASGTGVVVAWDSTNKKVTFSANTNYTTTGKNYKVQADSNGALYVNVPWSDSTYGVVSSSANGLAPQLKATDGNINSVDYKVLCYNSEANPVWKKLPANAFLNTWRTITWGGTNIGSNALTVTGSGHTTVSANSATGAAVIESSWRDIQVGGNSIGNNTLNFMPTGSVYVIKNDQNTENTGIYDVGFDIAWYNMSTNKYEYEYNQE